ncbi:Hypothetical predicted protein [Olea europaea subsp. europaea]|uniref:Uncharacterized protein n=1 Tax=Olea europaea subsp. europaea TaxID=158383 RepID=A0A8S0Q5F6_OLEEU|nr:Hypothetical predicted protein [Olea europaea subsp. europaea]
METEIEELKSELYAYAPVVASLNDDVALFEHNTHLHTKLKAAHGRELECSEPMSRNRMKVLFPVPNEIQDLHKLTVRVKEVGKVMEEMDKSVLQGRSNSKIDQPDSMAEIEQLKPRQRLDQDKLYNDLSHSLTVRRRGARGADDRMLELWETVEDGNYGRTIGESLKQIYKLTEGIYYNEVEKELGVDKLELSTRYTEPSHEMSLQEQLAEAEETAEQLVDLNGQLVKNIEESHSPDVRASPESKEALKLSRKFRSRRERDLKGLVICN